MEKNHNKEIDGQSYILSVVSCVPHTTCTCLTTSLSPSAAVIEHVRDGSTLRVILLPSYTHITVAMSGVKVSSTSAFILGLLHNIVPNSCLTCTTYAHIHSYIGGIDVCTDVYIIHVHVYSVPSSSVMVTRKFQKRLLRWHGSSPSLVCSSVTLRFSWKVSPTSSCLVQSSTL